MPIGTANEKWTVFIGIETNATKQLARVGAEIDKFATKSKGKIGRATKAFKGLSTAVGGAAARVASFAKRYVAMAGAVAGAAVIFKSISDAQRFGIAIAEIETIFEGSGDELAQIERNVLGIAEALGLPETIVAKGFYQIISADITDAADAMLVLEEGTRLATVGLAGVKETVDALTSVIKAYQRPVEDAADITNVLFRTVIKGKCVTGDTRILLADGRYERIDNLEGGARVVSFDGRTYQERDATWVAQGVKPVVRLTTKNGRRIRTTWEHPYLTRDGWKTVDELEIGEKIAVPTSLPYFGDVDVSEHEAAFLGLWIADGSCGDSVRITSTNYGEEIQSWAVEMGASARNIEKRDGFAPIWDITAGARGKAGGNQARNLLDRMGLRDCTSKTKHVPSAVFSWKRESVAVFLRWIMNGDGWLCDMRKYEHSTGFQMGFCSVSEQLVRDVAHLLLRFGVCGTITYRPKVNAWQWQTARYAEVERFMRFVGIDRPAAPEVLEYEPDRQKRLDGAVEYVAVTAIEPDGEEEVYDLCVPELHNFVAEDICAHNTTIPELAGSIGQVLPIAATLGVSLEEVAAAIATLTQGGIETNTAVIQLRQAMNQLLKPSGEALEVMQKFGLQISVANIRSRGFVSILDEIRLAIGNNAGALAKLFGNIRGLIPILALTGKQAEQFKEVFKFVSDDFQIDEEALERFLESPFKRFQRFGNAVRLELRKVGEAFIRTFDEVVQESGGIDVLTARIGIAFGTLEAAAETAAKAIGGVFLQLNNLISSFGGMRRAELIFKRVGAVISGAINIVFQDVIFLGAKFFEIIAKLPILFDAIVVSAKKFANSISIAFAKANPANFFKSDFELAPFPELLGIQNLEESVNEMEMQFDRARERITELHGNIANMQAKDAPFFDFAIASDTKEIRRQITLVNNLADSIAEAKGQLAEGPQDVVSFFGSLEDLTGGLQPMATAMREFANDVKALRSAFTDPLVIDFDKIAADFVLGMAARVTEFFKGRPIKVPVDLDRTALQINLFAAKGELERLAEDAGIELPLRFTQDIPVEDLTRDLVRDMAAAIESSANFPTSIFQGIIDDKSIESAEEINKSFQRALDIFKLQETQLRGIKGTELERVALIERASVLRRTEFNRSVELLQVEEKIKDAIKANFAELESQSISDVVGFTNFADETEKASRKLTDTVERQREAMDRTNKKLREHHALLVLTGTISEQQAAKLEIIIQRTEKQFEAKAFRQILGQEAFQNLSRVERAFRDIEKAAKEAAIDSTEITKAVTFEEIKKLGLAFEQELAGMLSKTSEFGEGFGTAWNDMAQEMGNSFERGIRLAIDSLEAFRSSFSNALAGFISGAASGSEAFQAFRESLAQSLARSISDAIASALTGEFADTLAEIFGEKVKKALTGAAADAAAGEAAASAGAQAIGGAAADAAEATQAATALASAFSAALAAPMSSITFAASDLVFAATELGLAGFDLAAAAFSLDAAAVALKASAVIGGATGGIFPGMSSPVIKPFDMGGFTKPIENLAHGGIKTQETFARIAEAGMNEAVVPLPGNGRSIPVEFKMPQPGRQTGRGDTNVNTTLTVVFEGTGNPREDLRGEARTIEKIVESALVSGTNRGLKVAVRRAANGI